MRHNTRTWLMALLLAVVLASCVPLAAPSSPPPLPTATAIPPTHLPLPTLRPSRTPTPAIAPTRAPSSTPAASPTAFVLTRPADALPVKPGPTPVQVGSTITGSVTNPKDPGRAVFVAAFPSGGESSYGTLLPASGIFAIPVPAGSYFVVAYGLPGLKENPNQPAWVGGFTRALNCKQGQVPGKACGEISPECRDHSLLLVTVPDNAAVGPLQPVDFSAPAGAYPPMPTPKSAAVVRFPARDPHPSSIDRAKPVGWISGSLTRAVKTSSAQRIVAFVENSSQWYSLDAAGSTYQMELPPGRYSVVSYAGTYSAGYASCDALLDKAIPLLDACGQPVLSCRLREVTVQPGRITKAIDPAFWYPGPGRYPPAPFLPKK